jgi:hypothetical protein
LAIARESVLEAIKEIDILPWQHLSLLATWSLNSSRDDMA